jgi:GcrA cell cycle regulator
MSWTEERIETLRRLWAEGLSASQIASALGGVSRNAVIGKIHRLGLSGRVKTQKARPARSAGSAGGGAAVAARPASAPPRVMAVGAAAVKVVEREEPVTARVPAPAEVVPLHGGVTLLDLKTSSCRWPLGDPSEESFRFCGTRTQPGETYCACHAEKAYPARGRAKGSRGDGS